MIAGVETENVYVTLITTILGVVCHPKAILAIFYLCAKFDDSSFSCFRHIIRGPKI